MRIRLSTCIQVAIVMLAVWLAVAARRAPGNGEKQLGAGLEKQSVGSPRIGYDVAR